MDEVRCWAKSAVSLACERISIGGGTMHCCVSFLRCSPVFHNFVICPGRGVLRLHRCSSLFTCLRLQCVRAHCKCTHLGVCSQIGKCQNGGWQRSVVQLTVCSQCTIFPTAVCSSRFSQRRQLVPTVPSGWGVVSRFDRVALLSSVSSSSSLLPFSFFGLHYVLLFTALVLASIKHFAVPSPQSSSSVCRWDTCPVLTCACTPWNVPSSSPCTIICSFAFVPTFVHSAAQFLWLFALTDIVSVVHLTLHVRRDSRVAHSIP